MEVSQVDEIFLSDCEDGDGEAILHAEIRQKKRENPTNWKRGLIMKEKKLEKDKEFIIGCTFTADDKYCQVRSFNVSDLYNLHAKY